MPGTSRGLAQEAFEHVERLDGLADIPGFQSLGEEIGGLGLDAMREGDQVRQGLLAVVADGEVVIAQVHPRGAQDFAVFVRLAGLAPRWRVRGRHRRVRRGGAHVLLRGIVLPVEPWILSGMNRARLFALVAVAQAFRNASGTSLARIVPARRLPGRLFVLQQVREEERRKAPRAFQPIARIRADEPGAELGVAFQAVVGKGRPERAALLAPQDFVNAKVELPDRAGGGRARLRQGTIDVRFPKIGAALQAIIDQEVRVQIRHHGRVLFHRRQAPAHPGDAARVVREIPRGEHVMADLMREDFQGKGFHPGLQDRGQADDHALIGEADHRKTALESLGRRLLAGEAQLGRAEPRVLAPGLQGIRPGAEPAVAESFEMVDRRRHQKIASRVME